MLSSQQSSPQQSSTQQSFTQQSSQDSASTQQPSSQSSLQLTQQLAPPIVIDPSETGEIIIRSRHHTPVISPDISFSRQEQDTRYSSPRRQSSEQDTRSDRGHNDRIESVLTKQGKQIRALYEMQKKTLEKIDLVYKEVKKTTDKRPDLSQKVFGVSNNFISISNYY